MCLAASRERLKGRETGSQEHDHYLYVPPKRGGTQGGGAQERVIHPHVNTRATWRDATERLLIPSQYSPQHLTKPVSAIAEEI